MTEKKKVFFHIPSLAGGGAERVAIEIATYFESKGLSVIFFLHSNEVAYVLPVSAEIIVARHTGHIGRVLEMRSLIKRSKPDAILSFLPYANLISMFAKFGLKGSARLVLSEHAYQSGEGQGSVSEWSKLMLKRYLYRASDAIIAVSQGVANDLHRVLKGSVAKKIVVVYNPSYIPNAFESVYSPAERKNRVLAIGRLVDDKGFDVLIRAIALVRGRINGVNLVIAGDGPDRAGLEALVNELGLSDCVRFPGFTRDIMGLYRNADLFVSSSRREGFGNVLVEALSFGLPIVATRCPGPQEILDGGRFGRLVPIGDEEMLAKEIVGALESSHNPLVQVARAREFALDAIGAQYLQQTGIFACRSREDS